MAKTNYQVTFNGKVVGIRKSDRIYTHAVVVHDDADASTTGPTTTCPTRPTARILPTQQAGGADRRTIPRRVEIPEA